MAGHSHKFTIADDDAVRALVKKLTDGGDINSAARNSFVRSMTQPDTIRILTKRCGRRSSMDF